MLSPDQIQDLHDMPSEDLRALIAHAAGIHAHRDEDDGRKIALALQRVAFAITRNASTQEARHGV